MRSGAEVAENTPVARGMAEPSGSGIAKLRLDSMDSTIRRPLWGAFAALALLALIGLALTLTVLQMGKRQEYRIVHGSEPLIDAGRTMDEDVDTLLAAARGYQLRRNSEFLQQYDDAIREF